MDNPDVLGLLEYGSSSAGDAQIPGDYDLLVSLFPSGSYCRQ